MGNLCIKVFLSSACTLRHSRPDSWFGSPSTVSSDFEQAPYNFRSVCTFRPWLGSPCKVCSDFQLEHKSLSRACTFRRRPPDSWLGSPSTVSSDFEQAPYNFRNVCTFRPWLGSPCKVCSDLQLVHKSLSSKCMHLKTQVSCQMQFQSNACASTL